MGRPNDPTPGAAGGTGFTPIRPNPYIVGNPVRGRSMFFGREAEFELVRKRFQDSSHGGLLVFCGERRSGKTSILFQILDRRLGPDFIPVLVDMQSMAVTNEVDFLGKIAAEILQALDSEAQHVAPPDFTSASSNSASFQKFVARVMRQHTDRKLILLFDEYELFESKIDAGILSDDTLHVLANLMEYQSIFMIFTGSQHLEARRRDYWKILGKSIYKRISYLDRQDALDLVQKPVAGLVEYADGAVGDIYRLTAGQPFYTQAVCQNLIDWLNEHETRLASRETVAAVADALVENPLPQMIFLWDSLAADEKLVLALLAETLADESAFATQKQLERTISQRDYPLDLDASRIAPALEKLFKEDELLLKNEAPVPGYAFRMDLWRRWIRRMHSVWQVMREEGFEIRPRRRRRPWILAGMGAVAIGAAIVLSRGGERQPASGSSVAGGGVPLRIAATPAEAVLRLDGAQVGIGTWAGETTPGRHLVEITATGFADTSFVLEVVRGGDYSSLVALRAATVAAGRLDLRTTPAGAEILVDGAPRGASPLELALAPGEHVVEATLPDREPLRRRVTVPADSTVRLVLAFGAATARVVVTSDPAGAAVLVDRREIGTAPIPGAVLETGKHEFSARLAGWAQLDTTVVVTAELGQVHLQLRREPPGELEVRGDLAARLYLDGDPVGSAHLYNWKLPLAAGSYVVRVVPSTGEAMEATVRIQAGEKLLYEYSKNGLRRSAGSEGGPP
jgi:hypothetical protein